MEPRSVNALQGWRWITAGYTLFLKNPLIWVVFFLIYFFLAFVLTFLVPLIGAPIWALLDPMLIAGFMIACRALEVGEEMEIGQLFAGFRTHGRPLAAVGAYYLGGKVLAISVAAFIATVVMGGGLPELDIAAALKNNNQEALMAMGQHLMVVLLFFMAFLLPLLMAYWFAPALVIFDGLAPLEAMKMSFRACLRNLWPFLVYGVAALVLIVLGSIPFMLGLVMVVPVLAATSIYAGYRDIFVSEQPAASIDEIA